MKAAELCAGYNGLGMAVEAVFGATPAWFSEFEEAPTRILAHHYPTVPNHGDMTKIDWAAVEPVDIISGGTPCQDLSAAGRRRGMTEGTRSNLWVQMREAIAVIKPTYVIWENVRGAYSADAASDLEHCPGCMGASTDRGTVLRALGRVLGDLSDLGYDAQWRGLRAADVGAPHGRFRVFVLATHRDHAGRKEQRRAKPIRAEYSAAEHPSADAADPDGRDGGRGTDVGSASGRPAEVQDPANADHYGDRREGLAKPDSIPSAGRGLQLGSDADGRGDTLAFTQGVGGREGWPQYAWLQRGSDAVLGGDEPSPRYRELREEAERRLEDAKMWGEYGPAIRRWEQTLGRRAPAPTEPTGRNGGHRLSARFAEWLMGVPDGWIVDVPGITRNEALKAAGNGVVPAQAAAALRDMLANRARRERRTA